MVEVQSIAEIAGVLLVELTAHADSRGFFVETYRREWFPQGYEMVQANRCDRRAGCVVGLHYHLQQTDYWYVPFGKARVVLHDLRVGSPTEGVTWVTDLGARAVSHELTDLDGGAVSHEFDISQHAGLYIPQGVAHGFASLTDCTIGYFVDSYYDPADELGVAWNDPEIAADWGVVAPVLSQRDLSNPFRADIADNLKPHWSDSSVNSRV